MGTITRGIANNVVTGGKLDGTDGLSGTVSASNIANASLTNITSVSPSLGFAVTSVASDPVSPTEGQVWYNTTSKTLKGYQNVVVNAAWATGGNLSNSRGWLAGSIGTQTAGIVAGGLNPSDIKITNTEEYDGTSWTSGGSIGPPGGIYVNTLVGTQTAGLSISGESTGVPGNALTQKYDGSSWTNTGSLNTARQVGGAAGTQTAIIYFGGNTYPTTSNAMENFNGTSWTTNPATIGTSRYNMLGIGTDGAALSAGGNKDNAGTPYGVNIVESWNGSSWTTGTSMPGGKERLGGGGTQTGTAAKAARNSVTRLGDLLDFGHVFKAFGNN